MPRVAAFKKPQKARLIAIIHCEATANGNTKWIEKKKRTTKI